MTITSAQLAREAKKLHKRDCGCRRPDWGRWYQHAQDKLAWDLMYSRESTTRWNRCAFDRQAVREELFGRVIAERNRQDAKFGWAESPESTLPGANVHAKMSVLTEEVGEVSHEVIECEVGGQTHREVADANLEVELIQVMAVCLAWLESRAEFGR